MEPTEGPSLTALLFAFAFRQSSTVQSLASSAGDRRGLKLVDGLQHKVSLDRVPVLLIDGHYRVRVPKDPVSTDMVWVDVPDDAAGSKSGTIHRLVARAKARKR